MKKIILVLLILITLIISIGPAVAETTIVPVTYEVSVDFQGERDFRLIMPNGYERHFFWNSNQTHSDTTFSHTIFYPLDEAQYCTSSNEQLDQYKNISVQLVDMLDICGGFMDSANKTQAYAEKFNEAEKLRLESQMMWEVCESDRKKAVNDSSMYKGERDEYKSKYNTCDNSLRKYKDDSASLNACEKDLENSRSNTNTYAIFAFFAGIGAGYFLWGRKKQSGPSEQAEAGYVPDRVRHRNTQQYPRFDDGPRE